MGKILICRDTGVDCDFVIRGETDEEIFRKSAEHAITDHGMAETPEGLKAIIRLAIRDERTQPGSSRSMESKLRH